MTQLDTSTAVLDRLSEELDELTPEAQKAARYVLENPRDAGILTVREIANAANVKPNTLVRMARQVGFEGYDEFREPFREAIRQGDASLPDRVRWLQDVQKRGEIDALYADMVTSALRNIEDTFANIDTERLKAAAEMLWNSRSVYTLGVGVNSANANNFTYLARMSMVEFHAIPRPGSTPSDDLAWVDERDALIAITCRPYRSEVVEAVELAKEQGVKIIAISDSPASPIVRAADYGFVLATDTSQFFPSSVSTIALLETLLSFIIAAASEKLVDRVEKLQARRHDLGLYREDPK
ncbi:MAG: MurR/RpiR family transcriptional regulator [Pseudomonadota bacterium]